MPVVVHLKNGRQKELPIAQSCTWSPAATRQTGRDPVPRWLVCKNERGETVGTFEEHDVIGFNVTAPAAKSRVRIPAWKKTAVR